MKKYTIEDLHDAWSEYPKEAAKIADILANIGDETTYSKIAELTDLSYYDIRDDVKNWARLGLVRAIKGTRGHESRVKWILSPKEVGRILQGGYFENTSQLGNNGRIAKSTWNLDEVLDLLSRQSGLPKEAIHINLKIPEVRSLLAKNLGIEAEDVKVRTGE